MTPVGPISPIQREDSMKDPAIVTDRLDELQQEWEEKSLEPSLRKMPESQVEFTTVSLKPIERLYTPRDVVDRRRDIRRNNPDIRLETRRETHAAFLGRRDSLCRRVRPDSRGQSEKSSRGRLAHFAAGLRRRRALLPGAFAIARRA